MTILRCKQFTVQNTPYVYQSNYFSSAWVYEHRGFYVDADGITYNYNFQEQLDSDFINVDINSTPLENTVKNNTHNVSPSYLFDCLKNSIRQDGLHVEANQFQITQEMIDDLIQAEVVEREATMLDGGVITNSLFVYDDDIKLYKQIILTSHLQSEKANQSQFTPLIIKSMGVVQ